MTEVIFLGMASATISYTVADAKIFEGIRKYIKSKNIFFGSLISCFYCIGHWIGFLLEIIYIPNLFNKIPIIDEVITSFVIIYLSAIFCILIKIAVNYLKL